MSTPRTQDGAETAGRGDDIEADSDMLEASNDGVVFSLLKRTETYGKKVEVNKQGVDTTSREEGETGQREMESNRNMVKTNEDRMGSRGNIGDTKQHIEYTPCGQELMNEAEISDSQKMSDLAIVATGRTKLVDNWTQTEEEYFDITPTALLPHVYNTLSSNTDPLSQTGNSSPPGQTQTNRLPQVETTQTKVANETTVSSAAKETLRRFQPTQRTLEVSRPPNCMLDGSQLVKFPLAKRPLSAFVDSLQAYNASGHTRHHSANAAVFSNNSHQVRTAEATRRLMGLYNGFNRTEVLQRFHEQYPEKAPDLREYSIREGRRHIIHGYHAYYFH